MTATESTRGSERRSWNDDRLGMVAFACGMIALFLFGVLWRMPTLHQANYLRFAAGHLAYSDVAALYGVWNVGLHHFPYLQQDIEYPVLIGLVVWLTGFAPGVDGYFLANAVLLGACLFVCLLLLARLAPAVPLARFALAPGLAMYGILNWDALAVVWLVAALYLTRSRRFGWAGVCLGAGASAKLFPAFALPILLAQALHDHVDESGRAGTARGRGRLIRPAALRCASGFVLVLLVLNAPLALLNAHGWAYPYLFQSTRDVNIDSIWAGLPHIPNLALSILFAVSLLAGTAWLSLVVRRNGRGEAGVLLVLLLFYLFTKVYSPQYDLWIVPMLALLFCPVPLWIAFVLVDMAYYASIFFVYYIGAGGQFPVLGPSAAGLLRTAVWAREFMLVALFAWGLTRLYGTSLTASWQALNRLLDARLQEYLAKYPPATHDTDR